jgi:glycerol kinase
MERDAVVLAIDQGTTGTTALAVGRDGRVRGRGYVPIRQQYPRPGWVEHDPDELWRSAVQAATEALEAAGGGRPAAIGLTNQRETTVVWERASGRPVYNAIVWQCRRSEPQCARLRASGLAEQIRRITGLVVDPYFSATKLQWLFEHQPELRSRAEAGQLAFGTVDTWLLWNLTGGRVHATDPSNASRTMLFDLRHGTWSEDLLAELDIPRALLPEVRSSSEIYGETIDVSPLGRGIPVAGIAGDQQAALFGQACFTPGMLKTTYGTGCFLLMHTGTRAVFSQNGLLTTVAWRLGAAGQVEYALEGSVFVGGAVVQWLRDELGLLRSAAQSEEMARSVSDTGGVYVVPAFVGLGAPYWDASARGVIVGLTRGTGRAHLVRAALESIAYQVRDVVEAMTADAGAPPVELRVDGGAAENSFLMQFQADQLGLPVVRPVILETTALGAAFLAGLATGVWHSQEEIARLWQEERRFLPAMPPAQRERLYRGWHRAVERAKAWAVP